MPNRENVFICRAENLTDIIELKYEWNNKINQFELEIKTDVYIGYLKNIMQTIPYLHVMIGSLRPIELNEDMVLTQAFG